MSRAKYHLLASSDRTPALEVNLVAAASSSSSSPRSEEDRMTEINLNEQLQQQQQNVDAASAATAIAADSADSTSTTTRTTVNNNNSENVNINLYPAPSPNELPSYSEALKLKKLEAGEVPPTYNASIGLPSNDTPPIITIDAADLRAIAEASDPSMSAHELNQEIGSECMFLSAFMIAFFFNWVGFFISICLLQNPAGKYGALSGFGLSMAKWVTIVKYQEWMTNMNEFQQKLFFWFFIFSGFYLFFRGLINYTTLKYRPALNAEYQRRNRNRFLWFVE